MYHSVVKQYNKIHGDVASGNMDDFANALKDFSYIAPIWSKWKASSIIYTRGSNTMQGGSLKSTVVRDNVVRMFAGDYDIVPKNEEMSNGIIHELVLNPSKFNTMNDERKRQISHALATNKNQFTNIVADDTRRIHLGFQKLNLSAFDSFVANHQDILNPYSASIAGGSNGVNENLIQDTRNCLSIINDYVSDFSANKRPNEKTKVSEFTNFICDKLQPTLSAFKESCRYKYGAAADEYFNKLANFPEYSFLAVCDSKTFDGGKPKPELDVRYVIKNVEVPKYINNYQYRFLEGGAEKKESAIKLIVDSAIASQTEYVKSFDTLFRELKNKLLRVNVRGNASNSMSLYAIYIK